MKIKIVEKICRAHELADGATFSLGSTPGEVYIKTGSVKADPDIVCVGLSNGTIIHVKSGDTVFPLSATVVVGGE